MYWVHLGFLQILAFQDTEVRFMLDLGKWVMRFVSGILLKTGSVRVRVKLGMCDLVSKVGSAYQKQIRKL